VDIYTPEFIELSHCYNLNAAYATTYVWQMQSSEHERRTEIRFDSVRLPRPMQVAYPRSADELLEHWQQEACFLVISNPAEQIVGFVDAQPRIWQNLLWISNLVIDKASRRQGYGTRLLQAVEVWARQEKIDRLMLEMQTKNYPAIAFAQKHGFKFCGYNDRYYPNGDIALFFEKSI
jgi:ribosomal protein S18 acetylase RimI-like enzyme